MRVLFLTAHKYLPEVRGGMEINTHMIANSLLKKGHEVAVAAQLHGTGYIGINSAFKIKMFRRDLVCDRTLGYPTWRSWDTLSAHEQIFDRYKPDVVILQGGHNFIRLMGRTVACGVPVIGYLHSADRLPLSHHFSNSRLIRFIANSRFTASLHPEKHFDAVVPPLIQPQYYATPTNRSKAVFVNPRPYKGLDIALELAKHRRDVNFLFVRTVRPKRSPKDSLRYENIRYVGPVRDMRSVYSLARLVLAPSVCEETWGRIATEAHVSGIPVLASTQGGLPESVGDGGICLPLSASAGEWQKAFNQLWDNEATYQHLVDAAYVYSRRKEIDPDNIISKIDKVLSDAVAERQSQHAG